jgi:hypothetical protein
MIAVSTNVWPFAFLSFPIFLSKMRALKKCQLCHFDRREKS